MIGLGLGLVRQAVRNASGQLWTPAQLFSSGEQGVWYEPKPEYLYQDAAGTVPVAADGDPVGYMQDLSGNGNHVTQSTSAARPIYRTDGVLHWLEPDGVDDTLETQDIDFTAHTKLSVFAAIRKLGDNQGVSPIFMLGEAGSISNGFAMYAPHKSSARKVAWSLGGSDQRFMSIDAFPAPVNIVQSARFDNSATDINDAIRPRVNGQAISPTEVVAGSESTVGFRQDAIRLFLQAGTIDYSPNPFYGGIVSTGGLDESGMDAVDNYLANLAGITL